MNREFAPAVSKPAPDIVQHDTDAQTGICNTPVKGLLIGYARVSTDDQRLDLQRDALLSHGVDPEYLFEEYISGVKSKRPQLETCLKILRRGDVLVVWRLDRLGRSIRELVTIAHELNEKGVEFRSLTESIDTTSTAGRFVLNILAAVAQLERDLISERTKAGLKAARLRGHKGGRKPKLTDKDRTLLFKLLADPTYTQTDAAKLLGVSRATIGREIKLRQDEQDKKKLDRIVPKKGAGK